MKRYSKTHEWIATEGDIGTVGITNHAQEELGDIVYVELPKAGKQLQAGNEAVILESTKAAVDVYSPVSGEIIEVNKQLENDPGLINRSPEQEGWIYKIRFKDISELDAMDDENSYKKALS